MAKGWSLGALVASIKSAAFLDVGVVSNTVAAGDDSRFQTPGLVFMFAGTSAPVGSLKCNGDLVSRTTYARLFSVIGTYYGPGDGSTTFQLPDLRGEFIRGWDDGRGVDSGRVILTSQSQSVQQHTHDLAIAYSLDRGYKDMLGGRPDSDMIPIKDMTNIFTYNGSGNYYLRANDSTGVETRPRNVALLYCIKT